MTSLLKVFFLVTVFSVVSSCSKLLQNVSLTLDGKDRISQEEFTVIEKTLTLAEAKSQKSSPYNRQVMQDNIGKNSRLLPEFEALKSQFPESQVPPKYTLGKGDTLTFLKLIENSNMRIGEKPTWPAENENVAYQLGIGDTLDFKKLMENSSRANFQNTSWPKKDNENPYVLGLGDQITLVQVNENSSAFSGISREELSEDGMKALRSNKDDIIRTTGRIGSDGSVLLLEVGRLNAFGKTINSLRSEVRNIFIRNGISPKFQLDISGFNSQRAYLTVNSKSPNKEEQPSAAEGVIPLTDQPLTLRELLSRSSVSMKPGVNTSIKIQRNNVTYSVGLNDVFEAGSPKVIIKDKDHIFVDESVSKPYSYTVKIGQDGYVVLPNIGKIKVDGKSIEKVEKEVRELSKNKDNFWQDFTVDISGFNSQRAYLTVNSKSPNKEEQPSAAEGVIPLTDQPLTLRELLSRSSVSMKPGVNTSIKIQRNNVTYSVGLNDVFEAGSPKVIIKDKDHIFVDESVSKPYSYTVKIGQDGYVVLPNIGKIKVDGKSIEKVEKEVRELSKNKDNFWQDFTVDISGFNSQRAIITIIENHTRESKEPRSKVVTIKNTPMRLDEVLTNAGVTTQKGKITKIQLLREDKIMSFSFENLLKDANKEVFLRKNDRVIVEELTYKQAKIFILGAGLDPKIFNISPSNRETLADALFTENGAVSSIDANRSEVYLLRGDDPVIAYHLNALSTSRLIVAEAMELRPNDILFVSEQPLSSFNRVLERIFPLRSLISNTSSN